MSEEPPQKLKFVLTYLQPQKFAERSMITVITTCDKKEIWATNHDDAKSQANQHLLEGFIWLHCKKYSRTYVSLNPVRPPLFLIYSAPHSNAA